MWQHRWAVGAGILGATASCLAKLALDGPWQQINERLCRPYLTVDLDDWITKRIYKVLGDWMIHYRINLMPYVQHIRIYWIQETASKLHIFEVDWCQTLLLGPRLLCFIAMLLMNAYMLAAFLKGMKYSGSVVGTAITTACNFTMSAFWGALVWNERFVSTWWLGFSCVLAGVLLLSTVQPIEETKAKPPKKNISYRASNEALPNSVARKYGEAISKYSSPTNGRAIDASSFSGSRPSISISKELLKMTAEVTESNASKPPTPKANIQPNQTRIKQQQRAITPLVDRSFSYECPLCEDPLFDKHTGEAPLAVADLSPTCYHMLHARCLKHQQTLTKLTTCPICSAAIPMFINAKQAAHFGGFWIERVEALLIQLGPAKGNQPQPASEIRTYLQQDTTLTAAQKRYISDDPTGLGKGLASALEWGGSIDYNNAKKGHKGWHVCLRTKGVWKYDTKFDDLWHWGWGKVHPRQRCDQCQLQKDLPVACQDCQGSAEAAYYCTEACQKRDKQRHKMTCQLWQQQGPGSKR